MLYICIQMRTNIEMRTYIETIIADSSETVFILSLVSKTVVSKHWGHSSHRFPFDHFLSTLNFPVTLGIKLSAMCYHAVLNGLRLYLTCFNLHWFLFFLNLHLIYQNDTLAQFYKLDHNVLCCQEL